MIAHFWTVLRRTFIEWRADNPALIAAGLSFYALFSLVPLMGITITLLGRMFQGPALDILVETVAGFTSPDAADALSTMVTRADFAIGHAGWISAAIFIWAGSRVFIQLQRALSSVWHVPAADLTRFQKLLRFLFIRFRAVLATLGLGVATFVVLIGDVATSSFREMVLKMFPSPLAPRVLPVLALLASLALFTILFACIYRWLPTQHPGWRAIWSGAAVGSVLFAVGRGLLTAYLRRSDVLSIFGATGSVIVLLIWIHYSMQILLFGAKFAWVIADERHESFEA